uniref:Olfactory receptor n=1 Tax=Sphenodon punctatus TaxID=8508 RepID=A0A8D0GE42_SPHPU
MGSSNCTHIAMSTFLLSGFPGLEGSHHWIAIPIFSVYLVAMLGNVMILYVIKTDPSLHQPMFYFLSMLALTDLGLCISTMPTVLGVLWFQVKKINVFACIFQLYLIHSFSFMESAVLFAMALDRFLAICFPLRYASILTNSRVAKIGLVLSLRSTMILLPPAPFVLSFHYRTNIALSHSYCLHQNVIRLACADTKFNSVYALTVILFTLGSDFLFILLSYGMILKTVLSIASETERRKALSTCVSHVCAVLVFYIPVFGLSIAHRFGKHTLPLLHVVMGNVYILFPPLMNPIIYSIKTKQIYNRIFRIIWRKVGKRRR